MGDTHFAMISEWMANGNIKQFVKVHWDANRFELVGFRFAAGLAHNRRPLDLYSSRTLPGD